MAHYIDTKRNSPVADETLHLVDERVWAAFIEHVMNEGEKEDVWSEFTAGPDMTQTPGPGAHHH